MVTLVRTTRSDAGKKRPSLGTLLKRARLRKGLSLRDVASKARISAMYLSLLERDACEPRCEVLDALANALGVQEQAELLFVKAGRVHPTLVRSLMRHPAEWVGLLKVGDKATSAQLRGLRALLAGATGVSKSLALLDVIKAVEHKPRVEKPPNAAGQIITKKFVPAADVMAAHLPPSVRSAITAIKAASLTPKDAGNQDYTAPDKEHLVVHELGHARGLATANLPAAGEDPQHGVWLIVHLAKGPRVSFKAVKQIMEAELGLASKTILIDKPEPIRQLKKILDDNIL